MLRRDSRFFRGVMVMLLALALSAVYTSSAQSTTPLPQFFKTTDGLISIRLPDGWLEQEITTAPAYSSAMAFGNNTTALQVAVDSLTTTQTTVIPGESGVIAILAKQYADTLDPATGTATLFQTLISGVTQTGGQVLQKEDLSNGSYPGSIALLEDPNLKQKGIGGVFKAGTNYVLFNIGASPEADFDNNNQMFLDIINAIRVPGEAGGVQPTQPVPATAPGVLTPSKTGAFSVRLPEGWPSAATTVIPDYSDALLFGSNKQAQQVSYNVILSGMNVSKFDGVAGFIGQLNVGGGQADQIVAEVMGKLMEMATGQGAHLEGQPTAQTFGGQYPGELEKLDIGYLAVLHSDNALLVVVLLSDDLQSNDATMNAILDSIRLPAEAASAQQPVVTESASTESAPVEAQTFRSSDQRVSLDIPGNWTVLDHVADGDILAYGDSQDAAMSRLYSVKPALATKTVITGNGGVVALYPMAQFGVNSSSPDLNPLMKQALANLQGYTVAQQPAPLAGVEGGVIAEIAGTEHGYLALIPFGDQIAYVTATGATTDSFDTLHATLMAIVNSVHVPAIPVPTEEPTEAPTAESSGLGGLGGLEATAEATVEATPEVTATPEASGLGGLGSLAPATPNATPES